MYYPLYPDAPPAEEGRIPTIDDVSIDPNASFLTPFDMFDNWDDYVKDVQTAGVSPTFLRRGYVYQWHLIGAEWMTTGYGFTISPEDYGVHCGFRSFQASFWGFPGWSEVDRYVYDPANSELYEWHHTHNSGLGEFYTFQNPFWDSPGDDWYSHGVMPPNPPTMSSGGYQYTRQSLVVGLFSHPYQFAGVGSSLAVLTALSLGAWLFLDNE